MLLGPRLREDDMISALLPRQPGVAPAGLGAAVVVLVELAFEAVQHVPDLRETRFLKRAA